jgi:uncharacterized protein
MNEPTFTSLRHPLSVDPTRGRVDHEDDYVAHVEQMMLQLLLTDPGERVNRPDFGCGIRRMLFAPNSSVTATLAQVTVHEALDRFMSPVLTVQEVDVTAIDDRAEVLITYVLVARPGVHYLNVELVL